MRSNHFRWLAALTTVVIFSAACGNSVELPGTGGTSNTAGSAGGSVGSAGGSGGIGGFPSTGDFCDPMFCQTTGTTGSAMMTTAVVTGVSAIATTGTLSTGSFATTSSSGAGGSTTGCTSTIKCPAGEFCDFPSNRCGAGGEKGVCKPKPGACPDYYQPTCGCDGVVHSTGCDANSAGVDQDDEADCKAPSADMFPCGAHFCSLENAYCETATSDVGGEPSSYTCKPLPTSCGTSPSCACLSTTTCGSLCKMTSEGGFVTVCPGG